MNKKIIMVIVIMVIALLLTLIIAMTQIEDDIVIGKPGNSYFRGIVTEVYESSFLVRVSEWHPMAKGGSVVSVGSKLLDDEKVNKGDYVEVVFDGGVMESWPLQVNELDIKILKSDKIASMYETMLDEIWKEDEALNSDAEFICIDFENLKKIDNKNNSEFTSIEDGTKQNILTYAKKYHEIVIANSMEELKEKGLFNEETMSLKGVLIYIDEIEEISENKAIISMVKYRSGLGAIFSKYELTFKDEKWEIKTLSMAIS